MISCVGTELVPLTSPLKLLGKVEIYLQDAINAMRSTLKDLAGAAFAQQKLINKENRKDWIDKYAAQIILLTNNITWSVDVEAKFLAMANGDMNAMKDFFNKSVELLKDLIIMVQGQLSRPLRQKVMCLITLDTHSRDVIDRLIQEHVRKTDEF